tara:strand:- start:2002 stop:2373 length:372 start_codon:yes stop_codon:yes gene_type:complete
MKFNEQIIESNSNIIKSYSSSSITINNKDYNYNLIVPPTGPLKPCKIDISSVSKDYIIKNLNENVNFVIIGSDKAEKADTSLIIQELNSINVGVEIMNMSSACSSHNILLSEKRNFLSFFLFK